MINLLPPKEKQELLLERNKKLVVVLGNMVLITLVCLSLVLFSLKFYILGEISYQKVILDNIKQQYQTPDFLYFKELIQTYNVALVKIDNFYKTQIYFSDALKAISEIQRPRGVYLTNVAMEKDKEGEKIGVIVSGVSDTRDNLLIFKSNIENDKKIENVYFPPDNWIKPSNINFYLTFKIPPVKKDENPK